MKPNLLAIDPGASGGFVLRLPGGLFASKFTTIEKALAEIRPYNAQNLHAVIEVVHASPVMGQASAFAFGANYGAWLGALRALDIEVTGVSPQEWQRPIAPNIAALLKEIRAEQGGEEKKDDRKKALHRIAQDCFPALKPTLKTCDAILIADYAMWYASEKKSYPGKPITL